MNIFRLFRPRTKLFKEVLKEYFSHTSKNLSDGTKEKHSYYYANILKFFNAHKLNPQIHEIRIRHMEQMRSWLLENIKSCRKGKTCTLEHASRHIEHCQAAFDYAVMMEYHTHNQIDVIKCQRDRTKEPQSLDYSDIKKLQAGKFTSELWNQAKDYLLFMCFTGINYMDLWLYEITQDTIIIDGRPELIEWVSGPRGKNGKPYASQFNPQAKAIHEKYGGKFPYRTNQALNKTLKKIAFSINIDMELSTSIGRKTYATLRYHQGMSVDGICDELGNTPGVLKKHYITRGKTRVKNEISKIGPLFPELIAAV